MLIGNLGYINIIVKTENCIGSVSAEENNKALILFIKALFGLCTLPTTFICCTIPFPRATYKDS